MLWWMERGGGCWEGEPSSWGLRKSCQDVSWQKGESRNRKWVGSQEEFCRAIGGAVELDAHPLSHHLLPCHMCRAAGHVLATFREESSLWGNSTVGLRWSGAPWVRVGPPEWVFLVLAQSRKHTGVWGTFHQHDFYHCDLKWTVWAHMLYLSTHTLTYEWISEDGQSSWKLDISIEGLKYKAEEISPKVEQKERDGKYDGKV